MNEVRQLLDRLEARNAQLLRRMDAIGLPTAETKAELDACASERDELTRRIDRIRWALHPSHPWPIVLR